jgi:hypothetical protein
MRHAVIKAAVRNAQAEATEVHGVAGACMHALTTVM